MQASIFRASVVSGSPPLGLAKCIAECRGASHPQGGSSGPERGQPSLGEERKRLVMMLMAADLQRRCVDCVSMAVRELFRNTDLVFGCSAGHGSCAATPPNPFQCRPPPIFKRATKRAGDPSAKRQETPPPLVQSVGESMSYPSNADTRRQLRPRSWNPRHPTPTT
ncbi:uncharacterized protein LY79DRAFT_200312 [Colletotrichum navitas]|uniref:Uncharacterized protein n=1 Tax=Colletotrichum navitas TaxID=681940 RepID=A0AAD8PZ46_9PEZI|nr:uncharacterized protein LY79DRAFT_200312 [Colletotrichum navitas]KAK1590788.1 hypothetical protein LY79DRAFT_200312 [Colletotrichum navitas]